MASVNEKNYRMVRLPVGLVEELEKLGGELLVAHEQGRTEVEICEQGERVWVPLHVVIAKALADYQGHRERSRAK